MSKRPIDSDSSSSSTSSSASGSTSKKRKVSINTFNKWQLRYEREHQTLSWLRCDVDKRDRTSVETLWCDACRQHESSITGMKNFSSAWITGSCTQVYKTSSYIDNTTKYLLAHNTLHALDYAKVQV